MTITRKRFTHTLLPALLAAFAGFAACSSDDDAPEPPKPSGYDIYTAGYTTPASKAVATVWKNGQLLYTLTDGTNDAWAYAVCVSDGTVYAAGYERQGDRIVAKVWENGTLKYTPGAPGADSYAYSVFAANGSLYAAGSEESGGALTAKIWKDGDALYAYSVSPAVSQARSVCVSGGDVYAAGSLQSGLTKPLAVVWKNDKAHYTLSDGRPRRSERTLPFGQDALRRRPLGRRRSGLEGQGAALHPDRRQFLCRSHRRLPVRTHALHGGLPHRRLRGGGRRLEGGTGAVRPLRRPGQRLDALFGRRLLRRHIHRRNDFRHDADRRRMARRRNPIHALRRHGSPAKPTRCTSSRSTTDASRKTPVTG
ncbi:MAG: hypothetical protein ACLU9X_08705 [Alistipes shahii]